MDKKRTSPREVSEQLTHVVVVGHDVKCWTCDLEERLEIARVRVQVVADQLGTAGCVWPVSNEDKWNTEGCSLDNTLDLHD
jgi:hypothetical protein